MIQARPGGGKIRRDDIVDRRRELALELTPDEIRRQMRSRRRVLEILRRMIAEREGRTDG